MLGQSWSTGSVVLAWENVKAGAASADDGMNVTYHEFAHQLDQSDGQSDGTPELESMEDYAEWSEVFQDRYAELVEEAERTAYSAWLRQMAKPHVVRARRHRYPVKGVE